MTSKILVSRSSPRTVPGEAPQGGQCPPLLVIALRAGAGGQCPPYAGCFCNAAINGSADIPAGAHSVHKGLPSVVRDALPGRRRRASPTGWAPTGYSCSRVIARVEGSELLWLRDTEVAANLASQVIVDIAMPWNGTAVAKSRIVPPRMTATFARRSLLHLPVECGHT